MGHSVNLLPEALGTILNCFMNFDFNNMIVRRVWGGGRQYLLPLPKHPTEKHLLTLLIFKFVLALSRSSRSHSVCLQSILAVLEQS